MPDTHALAIPAAPHKADITVYLRPDTLSSLDALAKKLRRNRSDTLDRLLRKALGLPEATT